MFLAIFINFIAFALVHQYEWRLHFANAHLDAAQAVTDAKTQYFEVKRAVEILQVFPKEGNYYFFNKLDPKTNLANAWRALLEIENYTASISELDKNSPEYQIGIYNSQEKIQYFEREYWGAFDNFKTWGAGGYLGSVSIIFGVIWFIFWAITMFWALDDGEGWETLAWLLSSIPIWIAFAFFLWVGMSPVFYSGPV